MTKRNGRTEAFDEGKFKAVLSKFADGLDHVDTDELCAKTVQSMPDQIDTDEILRHLAATAASYAVDHPDYDRLAARAFAAHLHKRAPATFSDAVAKAYAHTYEGNPCPLVSSTLYKAVMGNAEVLDRMVVPSRDSRLTYFGQRTLLRAYLLQSNDKANLFETPQYMFLRLAVFLHTGEDDDTPGPERLEGVRKTYEAMSTLKYTHATPTLFNAGTPRPQLSSCFLLAMKDDSIEGIFDTIHQCAKISKLAGGIGISTSNIRASGSYIRGTNGHSNGLTPMLRVLNNVSRYIDQGGGKRKGSIAVYLEPWHADIEEFLELRLVTGKEEARARDLFYALWISDLFMDRVRNNEKWSLFCPDKAPGLNDVYGKAFVDLYTNYEKEKRYVRRVNAQDLWLKLLVSQVETGVPYMLYKDACNEKSNQKNLGTIKSSNLCTEVVEYSSKDEVAVCNLASLSLPAFVGEDRCFDYADFHATVKLATKNLNRVIDRNMYPVEEAQRSNERHRPIGLGVQGLADCLIKMHVSYDSAEGIAVDRKIFEVMYHAAMEASWELAVVKGAYETFPGSPTSKGTFQFDLWGETEKVYAEGFYGKDEWDQLKAKVVKDGIRNSLLVAPMPTATTSQIMGNFTESFSPLPSVLYQRRTLSGDFVLSHPQFIREMVEAGLWNKTMQAVVQKARGCVEHIPKIPETIRRRYRSCWGMSQKWVIDHAAARGPFICQSQSMNVFMEEPTTGKLTSLHFYAHKKRLKTGMYYLRSQAKAKTIQFGVEECESCGS